jgi:hypothetical protein
VPDPGEPVIKIKDPFATGGGGATGSDPAPTP